MLLAALAVHLFLDNAARRGIENVGSKVTKVTVTLEGLHLSLFSGSGALKGLTVGNPDGYHTPSAIQIGSLNLRLQPGSLFGDKVVVKTLQFEAADVNFEGGLKGNNLSMILANTKGTPSSGSAEGGSAGGSKGESRKLEVDDLLISGGKVNVTVVDLRGKALPAVPVNLPEIHLTNLGTGPEGITAAELTKTLVQEIEREAAKAAAGTLSNFGKEAGTMGKNAAGEVSKGINSLFKKKN